MGDTNAPPVSVTAGPATLRSNGASIAGEVTRAGFPTVICCRVARSGTAHDGVERRPARGFTLLEMMIVLAVLATLAALSWPALRGQLETARLRDGAKHLRDELLRTRHRAVETGRPHRVRYTLGKRRFEILPASDVGQEPPVTVSRARSILSASDASARSVADTDDDFEPDPVAWRDLPEGVFFADPFESPSHLSEGAEPSVEEPPSGTTGDASPMAIATGAGVDASSSRSVVFYPNGRANNARLRVMNQRGAWIDVRLRGLTGTATLGPVVRREVRR